MRYFFLFIFLISAKASLLGQNNLVINGPISTTPGSENIFIGRLVGINNTTGIENVFIGHFNTGSANTTGQQNVFIGSGTGTSNTTGTSNNFIGAASGRQNTLGSHNSFYGSYSGQWNTTGGQNTFMGYFAGQNNQAGSANTFIGYYTGRNNENASNNVFIGNVAGVNNKVSGNVFIGAEAGYNNQTGITNTFVGYQSGYLTLTTSGNTFLGYQSGYKNISSKNTFIGSSTGKENTSGQENTFLGNSAGLNNQTGSQNVFLGTEVGATNINGSRNTFLGYKSGLSTSWGWDNTFVGESAGRSSQGFANTFLGAGADVVHANLFNATAIGANAQVAISNAIVLGDARITGDSAIKVGIGTAAPQFPLDVRGIINIQGQGKLKFSSHGFLYGNDHDNLALGSENQLIDGISHSLALGYQAKAMVSNAIILGGSGVHAANVGIGTSTPQTSLEIVASKCHSSGLRLTQLTNSSPAEIATSKFLTVNNTGDIVLARQRLTINNPDEWADKVFDSNYKLISLNEVETFVLTQKHLPNIPSAQEVSEKGVDLTVMNTKLLEKLEETTLYLIQLQKEINALKESNQVLQNQIKSIERKVSH